MQVPEQADVRKSIPMVRGLLDYFPSALMEVAKTSAAGNSQHNLGTELFWDRSKSRDHADSIVRHLMDRGQRDTDGVLHSAKVAWRALALLQEELEEAGCDVAPAAAPAEGGNTGTSALCRVLWTPPQVNALVKDEPAMAQCQCDICKDTTGVKNELRRIGESGPW